MKDEGIDRAIRKTLAERSTREQGACPDESRIAAYLDSRLRPEENAEFEAHAAHCEACREILALSMRLGEETLADQPALSSRGTRVLFHFAMPVSVLALLVIASGIGIFYFRAMRNTSKAPAETPTANLRAPAKPPEPSQVLQAPDREAHESRTSTQKPATAKGITEPYFSRKTALPAPESSKDEMSSGMTDKPRTEREKIGAPAEFQAERTEMKAESSAVTGAPPAGPGAVPRPQVTASRFRSLQANVAEAPIGAAGELRSQKSAASAGAQTTEAGRYAPNSPDTRKIGDRTFVRTQDIWVDDECKKHPEASQIEILPDSEEYSEILNSYPELRDLRPFRIFWKGRQLTLR